MKVFVEPVPKAVRTSRSLWGMARLQLVVSAYSISRVS
jgi:hypothetical protein